MRDTTGHTNKNRLHPLHTVLLVGTTPFFLGATLSDYAYSSNYATQWTTVAYWLNIGGLIFTGLAFLFAMIGFFRTQHRQLPFLIYPALLLLTWVLGFVNTLAHARDTWAMMPAGFSLSIVVTLLAGTATWVGFSQLNAERKP
ncbi:DUF2231 domain-containing protein [Halovibrio sp. HP20-50]|uniref:DUF2231 domain-containing protein n=1 Tax=Halovibrio sp. HP20-59 TaxID=3080275 RepID=UPI00294B5281|nr:DUF2231 domain-containing protein [Halovibrio sp. HP20-59]MEA2118994.1 DUF2231 domain-containing protein [Halovibrio sp. HP20-59]